MPPHTPPGRRTARPLAVWVATTVVAGSLGWALVLELLRTATTSADTGAVGAIGAVTGLCHLLLLASTTWAWAATTAVVLTVLRRQPARRVSGVPLAWRRLVLLACGGALSIGVAVPAQAVTTAVDPSAGADRPTPAEVAATILPRLDGLPLPRRPVASGVVAGPGATTAPTAAPTAPTTAPAPTAPRPREVAVRPGDTLWAIAAADLGPTAGTTAVAQHCAELHRLNRGVVGADPDLVLPGQRLRLP